MKRIRVFLLSPGWDASRSIAGLPPIDNFSGTHLYTSVERVRRPAQEHSTVQGFNFLLHSLIELFCLLLSGCVFRGHIYSSRMLCRKYVCRQAADAFVLRLHDVSGTLLKIIFHVVLLTNCASED